MLFFEYRFFYVQSRKILELQEQYRSCIQAMQKVLRRNNTDQVKEEVAEFFQYDAQIFSSDDYDYTVNKGFVLVNREPVYLKESMIMYLKDQKLEPLLKKINMKEWQDYTDELLQDTKVGSALRQPDNYLSRSTVRATRRVPSKKFKRRASYFSWPISPSNFWLSSLFGPRKKSDGSWGVHNGIDMAATKGTPVKASAPGRVEIANYVPGYGNMVVISHDYGGYKTRCAHLNSIKVKKRQKISRGSTIGTVGETGFIRKTGKDGSHLHFEVYKYNKRINPLKVLPPLS